MTVHEILLQRSQLLLQWNDRSGAWRCDGKQRIELFDSLDRDFYSDDPVPWAVDDFGLVLPSEIWAGESDQETWWALACRPGVSARVSDVSLLDGAAPLIVRLGPLLVFEWVSKPQTLRYTIDGVEHEDAPFRPLGDGPPLYAYPGSPWGDKTRSR